MCGIHRERDFRVSDVYCSGDTAPLLFCGPTEAQMVPNSEIKPEHSQTELIASHSWEKISTKCWYRGTILVLDGALVIIQLVADR
jgi:hypothetical protein